MALLTFALVLIIAIGFGLYSRVGAGTSAEDYMVGGRSFGIILVFVLAVGDTYSIGTIIGFPGGVYKDGAGYAIWFMGYILLGFLLGYLILPLVWKAGNLYNAATMPDVFRGHFNSRALELTAATVSIVFLIPWAQLQLTGLQVALAGLDLGLTPFVTVFVGVAISLVFVLLSGLRAPAFVSFVKDVALLAVILTVAIFVLAKMPDVSTIFAASGAEHDHSQIAWGHPMVNTVSTMLFQVLGFYMFPFTAQAVLAAKSPFVIRKAQIVMPLYMLMYPFLILIAYFAIAEVPGLKGADTNLAFIEVARQLLPDWLVGIVAGGAALCAIVVLAASALCIGSMFSRNIIPGLADRTQKNVARLVITVYLAVSVATTLFIPSVMGTLINTAYYGITQLAVPTFFLFIRNRVRAGVLAAGLAVGAVASLVLYIANPDLGGVNLGIPALAANVVVVALGRLLFPAPETRRGITEIRARWSQRRKASEQSEPVSLGAIQRDCDA